MNKITTIQNDYTEDLLVEAPTIHLFKKMGWETINAFEEIMGKDGTLGRVTQDDVVLEKYLYPMLKKLNDKLCETAITEAVGILKKDLSSLSIVKANHEIYKLLKDGVIVDFIDDEGNRKTENVRVIDWQEPENNDFLLVSQLWIQGKIYRKRADLIGFVNGIPLVFIELKATHKDVVNAYNVNYSEYKETIPNLFWYNGLVILSSGSVTKIGSITAPW
jgi:type I restriction enzyme R subunit